MLERFDFPYLPTKTRNVLEREIKTSESCGKASGSPTTVFPRVLGPALPFSWQPVECRSIPNQVLIPHWYQQCLQGIKANSVTVLSQQTGWGCARCCEETQLGCHLACSAWEGDDRSTSSKLNLFLWALCYCRPVRCAPLPKQPHPLDTIPVMKHTTPLVEDPPRATLWPHTLTTMFRVRVYGRWESQERTSDCSKVSVHPS